jgi:hypothetical protein
LDRAKRIYGHLTKIKQAVTRVRNEESDYSGLPEQEFDWAYSVYGNVLEVELTDAPEALGKHVTLTHYVDANLFHDIITGRSVTRILHLVNKTPIDWYSKKRAKLRSYRTTPKYQYGDEVPKDYQHAVRLHEREGHTLFISKAMCGLRNSGLRWHERHMALSFHRVREAITAKSIAFYHVDGVRNPADILSKHWGHQ